MKFVKLKIYYQKKYMGAYSLKVNIAFMYIHVYYVYKYYENF